MAYTVPIAGCGREETVQVVLFDSHLFICYGLNANALTAKCTGT